MRKNTNIIVTVIIAILIMLPMQKVEAANFIISNSKVTQYDGSILFLNTWQWRALFQVVSSIILY